MKIVIGVLSYNISELTDSFCNQLKKLIKEQYKLIVLDNGSDKEKIASSTTNRLFENTKLTGGMNEILKLSKSYNPDIVWLCTNDISLEYNLDPIKSMIQKLEQNLDVGVIHPSLIQPVPNYAYPWMIKKENETGITKNHIMVDIIAPVYTKYALNIIDWKFDKRFESWGIDWDSCYQIRKSGLKIAVDFDILLNHKTSVVYDTGNAKEFKNRQEYYKKASEQMNKIMIKKYGADWVKIMQTKFEWEK